MNSVLAKHVKYVTYEEEVKLSGGARLVLHDAGHILGSSFVELEVDGLRIGYTGDLGTSSNHLRYTVLGHVAAKSGGRALLRADLRRRGEEGEGGLGEGASGRRQVDPRGRGQGPHPGDVGGQGLGDTAGSQEARGEVARGPRGPRRNGL